MIVYTSRTGNVEYIVSKLGLPAVKVEDGLKVDEPYFIFTYTDGLGDTPEQVTKFLLDNHALCKGVIASGNTNFGHDVFCKCADDISKLYNVPIIRKIELRGFDRDYKHIIESYNKMRKGELI